MTLEQWVKNYLNSAAMSPSDVDAVFERFVQQPYNECMKGRWHDPFDSYPTALHAALLASLNTTAREYIDEVSPEAWYRGYFVRPIAGEYVGQTESKLKEAVDLVPDRPPFVELGGNPTQQEIADRLGFVQILALAADSRKQLRPYDVDRVMEAATNIGCVEEFRTWLLQVDGGFDNPMTETYVADWQPE